MQTTKVYKRGEKVWAEFDDGHLMAFTPYFHGFGYNCEGMRQVQLWANETDPPVFQYWGRQYRTGPREDEHKIEVLAEGYTQEGVAAYWDAAREYLETNYFKANPGPSELWFPWKLVCCEGWMDLGWLREGRGEFLPTNEEEPNE